MFLLIMVENGDDDNNSKVEMGLFVDDEGNLGFVMVRAGKTMDLTGFSGTWNVGSHHPKVVYQGFFCKVSSFPKCIHPEYEIIE